MKSIIDIINEVYDDTLVTLPRWADFIKVYLETEKIEFVKFEEVKNDVKLKDLKVGEAIKDDDVITVCLTDLSALDEK